MGSAGPGGFAEGCIQISGPFLVSGVANLSCSTRAPMQCSAARVPQSTSTTLGGRCLTCTSPQPPLTATLGAQREAGMARHRPRLGLLHSDHRAGVAGARRAPKVRSRPTWRFLAVVRRDRASVFRLFQETFAPEPAEVVWGRRRGERRRRDEMDRWRASPGRPPRFDPVDLGRLRLRRDPVRRFLSAHAAALPSNSARRPAPRLLGPP